MSDVKKQLSNIKQLLRNKFSIQLLPTHEDTKKEVMDAYSKLYKLKRLNKNKTANKYNEATIKELKTKIKDNPLTVCVLKHTGKNSESYVMIQDYPALTMKLADRKALIDNAYTEYVSQKKQYRKDAREVKVDIRIELGFKFKTVGGVFVNPVLALQSVESQMQRIRVAKVPSKGNSKNYIGIELELVCRPDKDALEKKFCEAYLGGYVYIKRDGSITPENPGDYCHEVTVLCPETMYDSIVERVCAVLNSKIVGSYVNNSCGLHVHYDARNRKVEHMFTNMVSVLPLATQMVPKNRINSSHAQQYCKMNKHKLFEEQRKLRDRYTAVNAESHTSHNTIEVRLHSGTTNATKIRAWVKIFLNAINYSDVLSEDVSTVSKYAALFGVDTKLNDYMMKRIKLFAEKGDAIDTRADHHIFNDVVAV